MFHHRIALVAVLAGLTSSGCSSCRKPSLVDLDAGSGMIIVTVDAGAPASSTPPIASEVPSAKTSADPAHSGAAPGGGGPFQGNYTCGSLWGPMHLTQSGDKVTATHIEAGGTTSETAQCTVNGNRCVGTYTAKDAKTGKPKGSGAVTIGKAPDGHISYQTGNSPAASCKLN